MALIKSCLAAGGASLSTVSTQDVANNGTMTISANVGDVITISGTSISDSSTTTVAFGNVTGGTVVDKLEQTVISGIIIKATASTVSFTITGGSYNRFTICK